MQNWISYQRQILFHLFEKEERWLLPNNLTFVKVVAECRSVSLLVFKTAFILSFLGDESHATILLFLSKSWNSKKCEPAKTTKTRLVTASSQTMHCQLVPGVSRKFFRRLSCFSFVFFCLFWTGSHKVNEWNKLRRLWMSGNAPILRKLNISVPRTDNKCSVYIRQSNGRKMLWKKVKATSQWNHHWY